MLRFSVRRIAPQECVVVPVSMDQIESMRLQRAYRSLRLRLRYIGKEIVELDTNLLNRNAFLKATFQHFILETFNINFQEVDGIVPIDLHLTRETGAG
jgi:hypothetical protein